MKSVIKNCKTEIDVLTERVRAKEAILKCVFSELESTSKERKMIREVLNVVPKAPFVSSLMSLEQQWCYGFEDSVCVSFNVMNTSEDKYMQPVCHPLSSSGIVRCVVLDHDGVTALPFIRPNSNAELIVGLSKSLLFDSASCTLVLELVLHPARGNTDENLLLLPRIDGSRPESETRTLTIDKPSEWFSYSSFRTAKEQETLTLLRCLRVGSVCQSVRATSALDFANDNPDFECCDFGDWQIFVGKGLMQGLVAVPSPLSLADGNIDRIYGRNVHVVGEFSKKYRSSEKQHPTNIS
ncbi:hypothetical protein Q1695_013848 [Nippostrongylus brasiliensis]|nr:hypothetical protein Q1695_013848 [Nippostrongylus brasiliensis]